MATVIQDDIGSDPLSRKTFSFDEDNWATEHNANWKKTVSQINELQRAILGDGSATALDNYTGDDVDTRVSELKSALFGANDPSTYSGGHLNKRVSDAEDTLAEKAHLSHMLQVLEKNAVGELASQAATGQNNPTIDIDGGINAALESGDQVILVDSSADLNASGELPGSAIETIAVDADYSKGTTTVALTANPSNSFPAGTTVFLDLPSLRVAQNLDKIQKILVGERDPDALSIEAGVGDHHSRLDSIESDVSGLEGTVSTLYGTVQGNTNRVSDFQGRLTTIETDVESASLKAQTFETADKPFASLTADYDGTVNTLQVSWDGSHPVSEVNTDEILVVEQSGTKNPKVVTVDADAASGSNIAISGAQLEATSGNEVYLASSSIAARVSARTDGTILLDGDIVRSDEFDGTVYEADGSGDTTAGLHYFDTDQDGNKQIGSAGWAATSGGEAAFANMYLRGYIEINNNNESGIESKVRAPLRMEESGQLINSDGTFWVGRNGVNTIVESGPSTESSGRSYSIYQGDRSNMLGSLSGNAGSSESEFILQAHKVGGSHTTRMRLLSVGDMRISAAGGGSADGILGISAGLATEVNTPMAVLKNIPEASGPTDLVENVVWGNSELESYFGSPSNQTELAKKMKGVVWIDSSDNYNLRRFDPSEYGTSPANPDVTPDFNYNVTDESTIGEVTVSFTATPTVKNATVVSYSWDFKDGGAFSEDASGENTQNTYTGTQGETETVTVRMKVTYQPDDDSQSESTTAAVSKDITVQYPDIDLELPPENPGGPIFRE